MFNPSGHLPMVRVGKQSYCVCFVGVKKQRSGDRACAERLVLSGIEPGRVFVREGGTHHGRLSPLVLGLGDQLRGVEVTARLIDTW